MMIQIRRPLKTYYREVLIENFANFADRMALFHVDMKNLNARQGHCYSATTTRSVRCTESE